MVLKLSVYFRYKSQVEIPHNLFGKKNQCFLCFKMETEIRDFFGLSFFMTSCDVMREMSILDLVCIERGDTLTIIAWTWYHIRILYIDFFF